MLFKDGRQRKLYNKRCHPHLREVMHILDAYSALLVLDHGEGMGEPEITVTEFWREIKESESFHPKFQAVDIRTKDRPFLWKQEIQKLLLFLKRYNKQIQSELEFVGLRNEHLHIEYDDGEPI